jgi:hypothetical protein
MNTLGAPSGIANVINSPIIMTVKGNILDDQQTDNMINDGKLTNPSGANPSHASTKS